MNRAVEIAQPFMAGIAGAKRRSPGWDGRTLGRNFASPVSSDMVVVARIMPLLTELFQL